jgi:hypothetical protein
MGCVKRQDKLGLLDISIYFPNPWFILSTAQSIICVLLCTESMSIGIAYTSTRPCWIPNLAEEGTILRQNSRNIRWWCPVFQTYASVPRGWILAVVASLLRAIIGITNIKEKCCGPLEISSIAGCQVRHAI